MSAQGQQQDASLLLNTLRDGMGPEKMLELKDEKGNPVIPTAPLPATPAPSATLSKSPTKKIYYSTGNGSRYVFSDGGVAVFEGGEYHFDPQNVPDDYICPPKHNGTQPTAEEGWAQRHRELEYVCGIPNPVFSKVPVPMFKSDAHVLREVGHAGGSVGLVGSFQAHSILAR